MDFKFTRKLIFGKFLGFHKNLTLDDSSRKMEANPLDRTPKQASTMITRRIEQLVKQGSKIGDGGECFSKIGAGGGGVWRLLGFCVFYQF
jgi:hypothetical protein